MNPPLVSVVVVNYNGRKLLDLCLKSLQAQTHGAVEVIVVDNDSADGSISRVREQYPTVRLVRMGRNAGFAAGCNAGIAAASGTYVATLNNDAEADPNWIAEAVSTMTERPDVGMIASRMLFWQNPNVINSAGISLDRAGIAWDRFGGRSARDAVANEVAEIFGPCAGAALYRTALLRDIGAFDERFFMYLEDVDLAWRAQLAGWRCLYCPSAVVYHRHSATSGEGSAFKSFMLSRNRVWLLAKNYPFPLVIRNLPSIVGYDVAASIVPVVFGLGTRRSAPARLAVLTGRLAGLATAPHLAASRIAVQRRRRVSEDRFRSVLDPSVSLWKIPQRYKHLEILSSPPELPTTRDPNESKAQPT